MDNIYFAKLKENAIIPTKRDEDGCYDIYACFDENEIEIYPHTIKLIPTGIASAFDKKYRLSIRERGSNTKSGLIVMAGQIDSGYRGEIFVALYNCLDYSVKISKSTKEFFESALRHKLTPYTKAIAQIAVEEVPVVDIVEISKEELQNMSSERGEGKLGSSEK